MLVAEALSSCDICIEEYNTDSADTSPHALECGHIFCGSSVTKLISSIADFIYFFTPQMPTKRTKYQAKMSHVPGNFFPRDSTPNGDCEASQQSGGCEVSQPSSGRKAAQERRGRAAQPSQVETAMAMTRDSIDIGERIRG